METNNYHIDKYRFGRIVINGQPYNKDLLICPDRLHEDWWRRQGHSLAPEDLAVALTPDTRTLLIGCGAFGVLKIPEATRTWLAGQGVELCALKSGRACEYYNSLTDKTGVVFGIHLTC